MSGAYQWAENAIARIKELERKLKAEKKEKRELEQRLADANAEIARLKDTETYGCYLDLEPGEKPYEQT